MAEDGAACAFSPARCTATSRPCTRATRSELSLAARRALVPGSDLELHGSIGSPTVRIDDLTVAGT